MYHKLYGLQMLHFAHAGLRLILIKTFNWVVFLMDSDCVFFEDGTEFLHAMYKKLDLLIFNIS
jgi:hypothetical protein